MLGFWVSLIIVAIIIAICIGPTVIDVFWHRRNNT